MLSRAIEALGLNKHKAHMKRWREAAQRIGALEPGIAQLSDAELVARSGAHKARCLSSARKSAGSRDDVLEESFALAREASKRILGMRHFDVQLIGAMALHEGKLAEMKTGEGKSLCLTLAAIHNALLGVQTHVVTVNEYLARRDARAMQPLYAHFDLSVGLLEDGQNLAGRRMQYANDIVYGVNHEFGFDYLRHNMARNPAERRMVRGLGFAIVDEVDSILIDEARTPLIISGSEDDDLSVYVHCWAAAQMMVEEGAQDVEVDKKKRVVIVSEQGFEKLEKFFIAAGMVEKGHHLYEMSNSTVMRALQACLQARFLYCRDQHYIVSEGKVLIVDENTGRLMPDRRWSNGIHQAMEIKEGVEVLQESKTMATITYQNFFGLYEKLSGLTGTAMTQSSEFWQIYGLEAVAIPTHMPMVRMDQPDVVFRSEIEKFQALAQEAKKAVMAGRPVLAGTSNIEESEKLSAELSKLGIEHKLLNAKNHALEAETIEEAGLPGRVTVATNMAGRGTDIVLGGHWGATQQRLIDAGAVPEDIVLKKQQWLDARASIVSAGGLLVLGCARNESRRVDNQLRGRSGRQGDPGESRFFISLDDALFRIYAQNGILAMIDKYNMLPQGTSLEHPMLNRSLDKAQAAVESQHFEMRKQLQDFDGVGATQRKIVYGWRDEIIDIDHEQAWETALAMVKQALSEVSEPLAAEGDVEAWCSEPAKEMLRSIGPLPTEFDAWVEQAQDGHDVENKLLALWSAQIQEARDMGWGSSEGVKSLILEHIDDLWQEHLTILQNLLDGIHLRSYAQKDPKQEYRREGYEMFSRLRGAIVAQAASSVLSWVQWAKTSALEEESEPGSAIFPEKGDYFQEHWLDIAKRESSEMWFDMLWTGPQAMLAAQFKLASKSRELAPEENIAI